MSSWEDWSAAYEVAYRSIPVDPHTPCPACGRDALRLVFTGTVARGAGYASFWCDTCLKGIVMSRTPLPEGAIVRSADLPPERRRPAIPDYELIT